MSKAKRLVLVGTAAGVASFWRCKMKFGPEPREVDLDALGAGDEERLRAEPMLSVTEPDGTGPEGDGRLFVLGEGESVPDVDLGLEPVKVATKDCSFAEGRPDWCRRGTVWLSRRPGDGQVAVADVKALAVEYLKPADAQD